MSDKDKKQSIENLENQNSELENKKQEILDKYKDISDDVKLRNWKDQVNTIKETANLAEQEGAAPINVNEFKTTQEMENFMVSREMDIVSQAAGEVAVFEDIINDPNSTTEEIEDARKLLEPEGKEGAVENFLNVISGNAQQFGAMAANLDQSGNVLSGYDELKRLDIIDNTTVSPIDVDVDQKMNVFFIDGSQRIFIWNQYWNTIGIDQISSAGTFRHIQTGALQDETAGTESWLSLLNDDDNIYIAVFSDFAWNLDNI